MRSNLIILGTRNKPPNELQGLLIIDFTCIVLCIAYRFVYTFLSPNRVSVVHVAMSQRWSAISLLGCLYKDNEYLNVCCYLSFLFPKESENKAEYMSALIAELSLANEVFVSYHFSFSFTFFFKILCSGISN